jgi:hypothetical protein
MLITRFTVATLFAFAKQNPQNLFWTNCFEDLGYGTERMRQKLFVVASGVLVNTSAPPFISYGERKR